MPRSGVGGKLERWMVSGLTGAGADAWHVGDHALVWWGKAWYASALVEVGGQGDGVASGVSLRLRVTGHDHDLWVSQTEWPYRLRPAFSVAPGGGRLAKGFCGREGDAVEASVTTRGKDLCHRTCTPMNY